jgi:hypothetical protein
MRISCEGDFLTSVFLGQITFQEGVTVGSAKLDGDEKNSNIFMSLFEQPSQGLAICVR